MKVRSVPASSFVPGDHASPVKKSPVIPSQPPVSLFNADDILEFSKDTLVKDIVLAHSDGYAGVILSGPPGTGKSFVAQRAAAVLADNVASRVVQIQFHPSYQYEDFIQGWAADQNGGFERIDRVFLTLCQKALATPGDLHVLVIDEISRADVPRVFGEALTYIETSKRNTPFQLASGTTLVVPPNIFIVATMNPWDISVDALDFAIERRFAQIEVPPDVDKLTTILSGNGLPEELIGKVVTFFNLLQRKPDYRLRLGHGYFARVSSASELDRLWRFQIEPHILKVTRQIPDDHKALVNAWQALFPPPPVTPPDLPVTDQVVQNPA